MTASASSGTKPLSSIPYSDHSSLLTCEGSYVILLSGLIVDSTASINESIPYHRRRKHGGHGGHGPHGHVIGELPPKVKFLDETLLLHVIGAPML